LIQQQQQQQVGERSQRKKSFLVRFFVRALGYGKLDPEEAARLEIGHEEKSCCFNSFVMLSAMEAW
jgi:hypothetical protein